MFREILGNLKEKNRKFVAMLVLGIVLSACSSGAEKSVVSEDMSSGKEQELSGTGEAAAKTEDSEMHGDVEGLGGNSGLADKEQNGSEESENIPAEEMEVPGDSGTSDNMPELTEKDQGQQEEGQQEGQQETGQKQPEGGQSDEQVQTWKSTYLEVIYHLWDYLAPRYDPLSHEDLRADEDPMNIYFFYFGLHDFDGDGTLELITGDSWGLAVFTYQDGCTKKIADLCEPDLSRIWCVDGVYFKNNSIRVECNGSGGSDVVSFGYQEGEYLLGHYNERTPTDPITINGKEATMDEIEKIYTVDFEKIEKEESRERFRLINESDAWILRATWWSDEESVLDINFDFDSVLW